MFNPKAFDRYAYVLNNPLRYTDPSGHGACDGSITVPECEDEKIAKDGKVPHPNPPTPVDPAKLDDFRWIPTYISGRDFYNWYLDLWYRNGWWWEMFGRDGDGFTIWDAFAVIYVQETYKNWTNPHIAEAAIRDANSWCYDRYEKSCSVEGYVNHFAHEYSSAGTFVRAEGVPHDPRGWVDGFTPEAAIALGNVAHLFSNHPVSWDKGCVDSRPCGWANNSASMYPPEVRQHLHDNQEALFVYNPSGSIDFNPWFIPSGCAKTNWISRRGRDLTLICDPVR